MSDNQHSADIDSQMGALLEALGDADTTEALVAGLLAQEERIRTLSAICQKTRLFEDAQSQFADFKAELENSTPHAERLAKSWLWLLGRITSAPTRIHMRGAVRLCIPLVASYLPTH